MTEQKTFPHFGTDAIHAGQDPDQWNFKSVVPPISLSTTFKQDFPGDESKFVYSRSGNPTRNVLEACIAKLENAKHCLCYSSGLAATTNVTHLLTSGDHVISSDDVYGGTNRYFRRVAMEFAKVELTFVDITDVSGVRSAIKPNTKLIWIETPTNPMMKLADIEGIVKVARESGHDIVVVVDNTFATPYNQRPLDLGADLVMHSLTKYMNGHSDAVMGCVATNDEKMHERLRFLQNAMGAIPSPFDCYLINRGLKTLHVRMERHGRSAMTVAQYLETDSRVVRVHYPGLPSHPQHELAKRQMRGFSGMVSFVINGGKKEADIFLQNLKIFCLAESLGGFESLAELPAIMTHASVPDAQRQKLGISDGLVRLSVGLEDAEDLIDDLKQALDAAFKTA